MEDVQKRITKPATGTAKNTSQTEKLPTKVSQQGRYRTKRTTNKRVSSQSLIEAIITQLEISNPADLMTLMADINPLVRKDDGGVYSLYNSIFLSLQARARGMDLSDVKGMRAWNTYGRMVQKGARALYVFSPCIKKMPSKERGKGMSMRNEEADRVHAREVEENKGTRYETTHPHHEEHKERKNTVPRYFIPVPVFDYSDTMEMSKSLKNFLATKCNLTYKKYMPVAIMNIDRLNLTEIVHNISAAGYSVNFGYTGQAHGYIYTSTKSIQIHTSLTDREEVLAILAHELAHGELHNGTTKPKRIKELEAEITAYIVMRSFGVDTLKKSTTYAKHYHGTKEDLIKSFDAILKTADRVYSIMTGSTKGQG
ncbi:MAG: hypothetical protein ACOCXT_05885 [Candidatus Dojkabacteria bacterium]